MKANELKQYWSNRYVNEQTGWDIGGPSKPLRSYIDQLNDKNVKILIPGAGNAYEAEYLFNEGFTNVTVLDVSEIPLRAFRSRVPEFPQSQLIQEDFFEHDSTYDLIFEQTFFCSFEPTSENRLAYGKRMSKLLQTNGKLIGVWFNHPLLEGDKRPFGGTKEEYLSYLRPYFQVDVFEDCNNSIESRQGKEIFGIFTKK